jgi:hypothetical protein
VLTTLTREQRELAAYMSELSERCFSAGWIEDLEHALWRSVTAGPFRYGHLQLTVEHASRLKALSDACGGWIRFDETFEELFVPLAEWIEDYEPKRAGL